jgi:23S rRNA maturation mini-RNase III
LSWDPYRRWMYEDPACRQVGTEAFFPPDTPTSYAHPLSKAQVKLIEQAKAREAALSQVRDVMSKATGSARDASSAVSVRSVAPCTNRRAVALGGVVVVY